MIFMTLKNTIAAIEARTLMVSRITTWTGNAALEMQLEFLTYAMS